MKITSTPATPTLPLTLSGVNPARAKSTRPRQTPPSHPASEDAPSSLDGRLPDSGMLHDLLNVFDHLCADGWPRQHAGQSEPEVCPPLDANGVGEFVRERLVPATGSSLTVDQAYYAYCIFCGDQGRTIISRNSFDGLIDCLVEHHLQLRLRHDIPDCDGIPQPGWKGIKLV